ncbi:hypothetical protein [Deinococcus sp.]|uniref:hypothetical protein n=1 Tax=Deinococcus sp. TaxID=47478 RepID=UPI003CC50FF5
MKLFVSAMLLLAAAIHLLPLVGVLGAERLERLYGLTLGDPNLTVLMRHRAVLFGLLGAFLVYAAFSPPVQTLAFVAGLVSVASFLWLARPVALYNPQIRQVASVDIAASACLIVGGGVHLWMRT